MKRETAREQERDWGCTKDFYFNYNYMQRERENVNVQYAVIDKVDKMQKTLQL